jgi:ABC-type nitrate/sulfonate/bicarbonate transport system substrate-binding protein
VVGRLALTLATCALAATGCGGVGGPAQADADVTLLLGEPPAGVHAGIFLAAERDFDAAEGLDLEIRASGDARRLLRNGRVQAAVLDRDAVAGTGAVCVMALTQIPEPDHFVCVTRTALDSRRAEVEGLVRALQRGYVEAGIDPESAVQAMLTARGGLDRDELTAQLDALSGSFEAGVDAFGMLRRDALPPGEFAYGLVGPVSRD